VQNRINYYESLRIILNADYAFACFISIYLRFVD